MAFAQNIGFSSSTSGLNKTYNFSYIPPAGYPVCNAANPYSTRASLFIEFGDGNFLLEKCSFLNTYKIQAGSMKVLLKATGIYDGGPRPKRIFSRNFSGINTFKNNGFPALSDSNAVKITANSNQLVAGDEAVFAITLKTSQSGELVFLYDNPGNPVFVPVNSATTIPAYTDDTHTADFMAIRTYNNASVSTTPSAAAQGVITTYITQFLKSLVFSVGSANSIEQRNIFITFPVKNSITINLMSKVKAVFIPTAGNNLEHNLDLQNVSSRDPNNINAHPLCMEFDSTRNSILYTVNFQNMGNAIARNIVIDVDLSKEIQTESGVSLSVFLKENRINRHTSILPPSVSPECNSSGYNYWIDETTKQLKIRICNAYLRGIGEENTEEKLTKGYVLLKVNADPAYLGAGAERSFKAKAAIKFDNNAPVITDPVFVSIKKDCSPCQNESRKNCCCSDEKYMK
jgi:hypothetical protein